MESQLLLVRSHPPVVASHHQHGSTLGGEMKRFDGRSRIPSSLGKQHWQFRVEKRVTLRPPRKTSTAVEVRAKKSGLDLKLPGSLKLKKSEENASVDDEESTPGSGTKKFATGKLQGTKKLPGTVKLPGSQRSRRKDNNLVFVAGATGKVGRRVVRELVRLGYNVRAGVRNVEKAQFLVQFSVGKSAEKEGEEPEEKPETKPSLWASFAPEKLFGFLGSAKKKPVVDLVEVDIENPEEIEDAIGNAGVVVCTIGASEKEALNVTAPYRIDFKATENLINAASDAKVNHFVLVTSLGTQKVGWPAAVLNLFWGVLVWKAKAEKALISSGIPFTIIRPGGMEKPTDAYKETHNLLLDTADSRFGGQVSNLQVAELIGGVVSNLELSRNKILEAVAETTAPLRPIEDLLAELPSIDDVEADKVAGTQKPSAKKAGEEEKKLAKRGEAKVANRRGEEDKLAKKNEAGAAKRREEQERVAAEEKRAAEQAKTEALREKLQKQYASAKERQDEAKRDAEGARLEKEELEKRVAELRSRVEEAAQAAKEAKAVEAAVLAAVQDGKTLSDKEKKNIVDAIRAEAKAKAAEEKAKKEAERKAIREAEAAKVEAEKKRKAEEARVVAEAERAAKAEADRKAKAEAEKREGQAKAAAAAEENKKAEAKAKAEALDKATKEAAEKKAAEAEKREGQAKAAAAAEENKKAEAKAKAEALDKATKEAAEKKAAETKSKLKEEEEILKVAAEAKAKEEEANAKEEEEKLKAEAEAKAKEEEEKLKVEAEAKAKQEEEKLKAGAEAKAKEEEELEAEKLRPVAEANDKKDANAKALGEKEKAKEVQVVASGDVFAEKKPPKAFRWPWQKEPETEESEPVIQDAVTEETVKEKSNELSRTQKPLSPYAQYPDLKPPSSPKPPTTSINIAPSELPVEALKAEIQVIDAAEKVAEVVVNTAKGAREQAPVASSSEDEKAAEEKLQRLASQAAAEAKARDQAALGKAKAATFLWPWQKAKPVELETSAADTAPVNQAVTERVPLVSSSSTSVQDELPRSNRPLSPYTRYPGLKPPSSPTPSAPTSVSKSELGSNSG